MLMPLCQETSSRRLFLLQPLNGWIACRRNSDVTRTPRRRRRCSRSSTAVLMLTEQHDAHGQVTALSLLSLTAPRIASRSRR